MGEITVQAELENVVDRVNWEDGRIDESEIRSYKLEATVDTGAVMLVLPQNVVEKLGLRNRRTVIVSYADERKEERPVAGPLTIKLGDRFMTTDCVVGPPLSEPLVGQVVLEELDLLADCTNRKLTPRPESPDYPLLKLK
ncbi:MAG TPA: aspartyl protease family protein [Thermoanaerobaculia bacterium]|jgi:clan AA aspartic protease